MCVWLSVGVCGRACLCVTMFWELVARTQRGSNITDQHRGARSVCASLPGLRAGHPGRVHPGAGLVAEDRPRKLPQ